MWMPFYGEIYFAIVRADTGAPISGVTLEASGLHIIERQAGASIQNGPEGRIVVHQMARRDSYRGASPSRTFTFGALQFRTRIYSVQELASGTFYDPCRGQGLPTTVFQDRGEGFELPVCELTIRLEPSD